MEALSTLLNNSEIELNHHENNADSELQVWKNLIRIEQIKQEQRKQKDALLRHCLQEYKSH